jgi:hypothetical protein
MTSEHTSIMTERDPNKLKIASFRTKEGVWAEFCAKAESVNLTATDVLKMAMAEFIDGRYVPNMRKLLVRHDSRNDDVLTKDEIIELVNTIISTAPMHNDKYADNVLTNVLTNVDVEKSIDAALKIALEPITDSINELETYTRAEIGALKRAINERVTSSASPAQIEMELPAAKSFPDGDSDNIKPWGAFFKMVGIEALAAVEAQKPENASIRSKQIERGLQAAIERGLGEWVVKVSGRSFVRVTPPHTS